jgi:sialic acid synthase SpsE
VLLHCVSGYPVPIDEVNLELVPRLARTFRCPVGYSDHTIGVEAAVAAVVLGACVIEKHFTIDKRYSSFRDHQLSADPPELATLVRRIREARSMLGDGRKRIQPCERDGLAGMRRSVAAAMDLPDGTVLRSEHLAWVRPGDGLRPGQEHLVLGRPLVRSRVTGERIVLDDVGEPSAVS